MNTSGSVDSLTLGFWGRIVLNKTPGDPLPALHREYPNACTGVRFIGWRVAQRNKLQTMKNTAQEIVSLKELHSFKKPWNIPKDTFCLKSCLNVWARLVISVHSKSKGANQLNSHSTNRAVCCGTASIWVNQPKTGSTLEELNLRQSLIVPWIMVLFSVSREKFFKSKILLV